MKSTCGSVGLYLLNCRFCGLQCPVLIAWGEKDPWEPIELGRMYGNFDTVQDFVVLPDVGHCPQVFSLSCFCINCPISRKFVEHVIELLCPIG